MRGGHAVGDLWWEGGKCQVRGVVSSIYCFARVFTLGFYLPQEASSSGNLISLLLKERLFMLYPHQEALKFFAISF